MTQNCLGNALSDQAHRLGGTNGLPLLANAAAAYRVASEIYSNLQLHTQWAQAQNNTGIMLNEMAKCKLGNREESIGWLQEAEALCTNALCIYTNNDDILNRAWTFSNLGKALKDHGDLVGAGEKQQLLAKSMSAFKAAQKIYAEHGGQPDDRAILQSNIADALLEMAKERKDASALSLFEQAERECNMALVIYSQPDEIWATAKNNLGDALVGKAAFSEGAERMRLIENAVAAYRSATNVFTSSEFPNEHSIVVRSLQDAETQLLKLK